MARCITDPSIREDIEDELNKVDKQACVENNWITSLPTSSSALESRKRGGVSNGGREKEAVGGHAHEKQFAVSPPTDSSLLPLEQGKILVEAKEEDLNKLSEATKVRMR